MVNELIRNRRENLFTSAILFNNYLCLQFSWMKHFTNMISVSSNTTFEINSAHLQIYGQNPYDKLVAYWSFDKDSHNS